MFNPVVIRAPFGVLICAVCFFIIIGCSGTEQIPVTTPVIPDMCDDVRENPHSLLGYWTMSVNADHTKVEATPQRHVRMHFNVRTFLEDGPCTNCLRITGVHPGGPGIIQVHIELRHPFPGNTRFTGFDVRGIAIFDGTHEFPATGLITSDASSGDAELLNAEGHTRLFNTVEYAPGSKPSYLNEYSQGKLAWSGGFTSTLNGFHYFSSNYLNRNYFAAGAVLNSVYRISLPAGPIRFGYAVDASWAPPMEDPPMVPVDFPPNANCPEAWEITCADLPMGGYYMNVCPGSSGDFRIFIHDHQGADTIDSVRLECPELFDGLLEATKYGSIGDYTGVYDVTLTNEKATAEPGLYKTLIEVIDTKTSPIMHLIAYKIMNLRIVANESPLAEAYVEGDGTYEVDEIVYFHSLATDPNGPDDIALYEWDLDSDGEFEQIGVDVSHAYDEPGEYYILHRVTDLCGVQSVTDSPWVITIIPTGVQITLPEDRDYKTLGRTYHYSSEEMQFSDFPVDIADLDGPWDFTTLSLPENYLNRKFIDKTDPEVSDVSVWYNPAHEYFYKYYGHIYDIDGSFYLAEEHNEIQDVLKMWGVYEPDDLGPVAFLSPIVTTFPININTKVHKEIGIPNIASFVYDYEVLGEGQVIVPFDSVTEYDALMVRLYVKIETPDDFNGSALIYEWLEDDGKSVAVVAAINRPTIPEYHFDDDTLMYFSNGIISVNALESFED